MPQTSPTPSAHSSGRRERPSGTAHTTSQVAHDADLAISTASHHLTVLRKAGLIGSERVGVRMLHLRTPLGEALVGAVL